MGESPHTPWGKSPTPPLLSGPIWWTDIKKHPVRPPSIRLKHPLRPPSMGVLGGLPPSD